MTHDSHLSTNELHLLNLLRMSGATLPRPILNLGCRFHTFGDFRLDIAQGAANVLANLD